MMLTHCLIASLLATSGADGAYEEIIRDTLSSQPEGSIHISMENVHVSKRTSPSPQ